MAAEAAAHDAVGAAITSAAAADPGKIGPYPKSWELEQQRHTFIAQCFLFADLPGPYGGAGSPSDMTVALNASAEAKSSS